MRTSEKEREILNKVVIIQCAMPLLIEYIDDVEKYREIYSKEVKMHGNRFREAMEKRLEFFYSTIGGSKMETGFHSVQNVLDERIKAFSEDLSDKLIRVKDYEDCKLRVTNKPTVKWGDLVEWFMKTKFNQVDFQETIKKFIGEKNMTIQELILGYVHEIPASIVDDFNQEIKKEKYNILNVHITNED